MASCARTWSKPKSAARSANRSEREAQQRINEERAAQREPAPTLPVTEAVRRRPKNCTEAPSDAEQKASADAYAETTREVDEQIRT